MNQQHVDNVLGPDEDGISMGQVIEFLSDNWKRLAVGALIGMVLGLVGWFVLAGYKAETVLLNNKIGIEKDQKTEIRAVNFLSWRNLQKNLPILAAQFVQEGKAKPEEVSQLSRMENAAWWQKNVVPSYSLSKADTKELASISKELQDSEGQTILNLMVTAQGGSRETAVARLDVATNFIRSGSSYLLLKNLLNEYEAQVLSNDSELQKRVTDAEVELKFLRDRAQNLEALRQRFPSNVAVANQQIVDLKDSNAKFMPISTQLVAVNSDINSTEESLKRMRDKLAQMKALRQFVAQAAQVMEKESDGLKLAEALLKVESTLRAQAGVEDVNTVQQLNTVQADIVQVKTRFTKGLESSTSAYVSRPGPVLPAVGGLFGGVVVMLGLVLGQMVWARFKRNTVKG